MDKLLTILVPTYHAESFLRKGLDSLLVEEDCLHRMQVIVVIDGSPDASAEIARAYAARYPDTFEVLEKENGGHGSAINEGMKLARGRYLKVLDADDWFDTKALPEYLAFLERVDADAVISDYRTYDISDGAEVHYHAGIAGQTEQGTPVKLDAVMEHWSETEWGMTFHGIAYRVDFLRKHGYTYAEKVFYEDLEFATIPMCRAQSICFSGIELYVYRIGDVNQSVSTENQIRRLSHLETVISKTLEQSAHRSEMAPGGERYFLKKTSMMITGYCQIAMLKNPDRRAGRKQAGQLLKKISCINPEIYGMVQKKYLCFYGMSLCGLSNRTYERIRDIRKG